MYVPVIMVAGSGEECTCIVRLWFEAIWQLRPMPQNPVQCVKSVRTELFSDFLKKYLHTSLRTLICLENLDGTH